MWDLAAALDPRAPAGTLCLRTLVVSGNSLKSVVGTRLLSPEVVGVPMSVSQVSWRSCSLNETKCTLFVCLQEHQGRVFRLQFDEFEIISSAHDDTILIWDFLNATEPTPQDKCRI